MRHNFRAFDEQLSSEDELFVSRLVDGDLSASELEPLVDCLLSQQGSHAQWESYHLISSALQGHHEPDTDYRGFAARISLALDDEPTILAPRLSRWIPGHTTIKRAAGLAIAASVTAVTIAVLQPGQLPSGASAPVVVASQGGQSRSRPLPTQRAVVVYYSSTPQPAVTSVQHTYPDAVNKQALGAYLVNHNEYSPSAGMHGVLPYARIVSHENR